MKEPDNSNWLVNAITYCVVIVSWSFFCLYPAYWHGTMDDMLWEHLDCTWHVSSDMHRFVYPFSDLGHRLMYPVHNAALMNRVNDVVRSLTTNPELAKLLDSRGRTALEYAVFMRHIDCVTPLLEAGSPLDTKALRDATPLTHALNSRHRKLVALLVAKGARVDEADAVGVMPLHRAAALGYSEVISAASAAGVPMDLTDQQGRTALDYAVLANNLPMVMELTMAGAGFETQETASDPKIALYLALCRKTGDPQQALQTLAEGNASSPMSLPEHSYNYPAELPTDDRPVSLR